MKRLLVFVASAILLPCLSAQTGASVDIIRNHKTALSHVFDPATAADAFLIPIDQTGEMPMPTGINETLRKQVDAARTAKIKQKNLENRGIINDKPTPGNTTTPLSERGTDNQGLHAREFRPQSQHQKREYPYLKSHLRPKGGL